MICQLDGGKCCAAEPNSLLRSALSHEISSRQRLQSVGVPGRNQPLRDLWRGSHLSIVKALVHYHRRPCHRPGTLVRGPASPLHENPMFCAATSQVLEAITEAESDPRQQCGDGLLPKRLGKVGPVRYRMEDSRGWCIRCSCLKRCSSLSK